MCLNKMVRDLLLYVFMSLNIFGVCGMEEALFSCLCIFLSIPSSVSLSSVSLSVAVCQV